MNDSGKLIIIIKILNLFDNSLQHNINVYTILSTHIFNAKDKYINNNSFTKSISNVINIITFNKDNFFIHFIKNTSILIGLNPVKLHKQNKYFKNLNVNSPFIGTFNLETYNNNGIFKVYVIGFYTKQYYKTLNTFYIDLNNLDFNELILKCINAMLIPKYSSYTFYVHNLSKYDIAFLLKPLIRENINDFKYKLKTIFRNNLILNLIIFKKVGGKTNTIKIVNFYNILFYSLKDLCEIY